MQLTITRITPAYLKVSIDNPPINLFDPDTVNELTDLVTELENDTDVKVVVFESANPDFFFAHADLARAAEFDLTIRPSGLAGWPDVARRFELAPFITIGLIRGRARGVGSEFLQALDMRFASREKAVLAQIEIGCGVIPGGGGLERLPYFVGKGRAMEIILGSNDFDADTAAAYGWVNRSIPDAELDEFVHNLATRIASFDKAPLKAAKQIIQERLGLMPPESFRQTQKIFFDAISWPETQQRLSNLFEKGLQTNGKLELDLGREIAAL